MRLRLASLLLVGALPAESAELTPANVAYLVNEKDVAAIVEPLRLSLASADPLVRTTGARVAAVRAIDSLVGSLREQLTRETNATAAREAIRAIALLGRTEDIDFAIEAARKWPASIDADLATAIARRGPPEAINLYVSKLGTLRLIDRSLFFRIALWGRGNAISYTAARLLGVRDTAGWDAFLAELRSADVTLDSGVLGAALDSTSEEIRNTSVWYVARRHAGDPSHIPEALRARFDAPRQDSSNREGFGREIVLRMLGREKKDDDRWPLWLESLEADDILGTAAEPALFSWFTDRELATRKQRSRDKAIAFEAMTVAATANAMRQDTRPEHVSPTPVAKLDFIVPDTLPAGLTSRVLTCGDGWLGVATITLSPAGRVEEIDYGSINAGRCQKALETILRLSFATNTSIASRHKSRDILLVRAPRQPLCLDEDSPSDSTVSSGLFRVGGKIVAPVNVHRVDPQFPESARKAMGRQRSALIILQAVITKDGCIRNLRPIAQTPFPEINGAAIVAASQWRFKPGMLDGRPVDVIFNIVTNFKTW